MTGDNKLLANIFNIINNFRKKFNLPIMFYGLIILFIFFGILTGWRNISGLNLQLILRNSSILLFAAIGMTMVILVSQVDLSIGSVMSLSASITAIALANGIGTIPAIFLGLLCGGVIGLINGILIAVLRFDYWITTFATMGIGAGLALVITGGATVGINNMVFRWLGSERVFGIYVMVYFTVILVIFVVLLLKYTKFGYNIYSIGGSEVAARLSGINVTRTRVAVYVCSGLFAAIAGLLLACISEAARPAAGAAYSFDALAAVIIGGTSFDGGRGGVPGTILGTIILRVLANGLSLMGISSPWQRLIIGVVIVLVLVADAISQKRRKFRDLRRIYSYD